MNTMISINHDAPLRVAEFYSGIGGMHYALQSSGINYEVVAAFDINCNANAVYQHNFPGTRIVQKGIEHLSPEYFNQLNVDMFIMSPPCQPYTRMGLQLQSQDNRSKSFLYLLQNVVASIENKPRWLLVENVKGFDGSDTRNLTISLLEQCGYSIQEYLLSPVQFGVPNSRLRYYLIAELRRFNPLKCSPFIPSSKIAPVRPLSEFLDSQDGDGDDDGDDRWKEFLLPNEALWRYGGIIDMVNYDSTQSCCFTKNYFRMMESSAGSVIHMNRRCTIDEAFEEYFKQRRQQSASSPAIECPLLRLQLRFFKPREIARILCFPDSFQFPPQIALNQQYRLLGNSINVFVVACLIRHHCCANQSNRLKKNQSIM